MNGFELFREGRLDEALRAFDDEVSSSPSPLALANRALVFLSLGRFKAAANDARAADEMQFARTHERRDGYLRMVSAALWLDGSRIEAEQISETIVEGLEKHHFHFSDRTGGVGSALLLWFMATETKSHHGVDRALRFFQSKKEAGVLAQWPGPIAAYLLGSLSYPALMQAAQQSQTLALRRGCQAAFYAATLSRLNSDETLAGDLLKRAVEYGEEIPIDLEYFLALGEFKSFATSSQTEAPR